ncbi:hypothetical protein JP75_18365 [Devosia riboflavina]|uniref:DUF112 domain-containing protein n=1 Tax=Devosia riboflavina TaxID=46914 RepID=A0A087LZJ2_9HYPH|nr:tripartite tricarboxylate transporter permease [Devosia riboflavina]KFL30045.1 hypothetical protein JP75_18365 [Devosia riboflavina]
MGELLSHLQLGLSVAGSPVNLFYCLVGALAGTLIGVLPGLGPVTTVAMLLPITYYLDPTSALIMLAGIYYGAQYGGSTTAILVNMPGENSSVVTAIDGYQMARKGRAGAALAVAALASLFAGCVATFGLAGAAPIMAKLVLVFGAPEYFALMVLGLVASIAMANGDPLKAIAMIALGILLSLVGTDPSSGLLRMTMGIPELVDGVDFVPLAIGLFAVPEILANLRAPQEHGVLQSKLKDLWPNRKEASRAWPAAVRGTIIGSVLGILPGGGATLASFISYTTEKKLSRYPKEFGQGAVEGVAGPEAANNAGAQTSFIPLLTLGIPGNALMALLAGAMTLHGIQPGPLVMTSNPDLFWGLIASMWIGNLMLVVINLPLIGIWVSMLKIPYRLFGPALLVFCCIGAFSVNNSGFDVLMMMAFSLLGYAMMKWKFEAAPLVLAFVLGPMMEDNLRRTLLLAHGDASVLVTRPISAGILLVAVAVLVLLALPAIRRGRKAAFVEET